MSNDKTNVFERLFKLWAMVCELVMDGKRDPQKVVNALQKIVDEVQGFIVATSKLAVNYGRSIAGSIKVGKYDWVNDSITDENFPSTEIGEREVNTAMYHFGHNMDSDPIIAEMDKDGYRPATMKELLAYGEQNPDEQRKYPIVALGSVAVIRGGRRVGFLYSYGAERRVGLSDCDVGWGGSCRFLAVRK